MPQIASLHAVHSFRRCSQVDVATSSIGAVSTWRGDAPRIDTVLDLLASIADRTNRVVFVDRSERAALIVGWTARWRPPLTYRSVDADRRPGSTGPPAHFRHPHSGRSRGLVSGRRTKVCPGGDCHQGARTCSRSRADRDLRNAPNRRGPGRLDHRASDHERDDQYEFVVPSAACKRRLRSAYPQLSNMTTRLRRLANAVNARASSPDPRSRSLSRALPPPPTLPR